MKPAHALVPAIVMLAGAGDAMSQDLSQLEKELMDLEAKEKALEPSDIPEGNALQTANNALQQKLVSHPTKGTAPWKALAQRAVDLQNRITAKQKATGPAGVADRYTKDGAAKLDALEKEIPGLKAGDTAEANRLMAILNEGIAILGKASKGARSSDLFQAQSRRVKELEARIKARHAGTEAGGAASTPSSGAGATSGSGGAGGGADGLDLAIDVSSFASTDLYYWKGFADWYKEALAELRAGNLKRTDPKLIEDRLKGVPVSARTQGAIAEARALIARYSARRDQLMAAAQKAADEQAKKDKAEYEEINKKLGELQGYFDKDFTVKLKPPCDPMSIRAWIQKLRETDALRQKGAAMMAKIKVDYPRYAKDPLVQRLEYVFQKGLSETIARDIEHSVGRIVQGNSSQNGLLRGRIEMAERYLAPDMFNDDRRASDAWMQDCLRELSEGIEACEALRIFRTEYQGRPLEPDLMALGEKLRALKQREEKAAVATYEKARLPAGASSGPDADVARAAIVASGTPESLIARLVVSWGPKPYEEQRSSTTEAGGGWLRVETWTERGRTMQVTTAERLGDDHRMVVYDLKFIEVGHPNSPRGRWFCSGRFESRRIKPENIMKGPNE